MSRIEEIYMEFNSLTLHNTKTKAFETNDKIMFENKFNSKLPISIVSWLSFSNGSYLANGVFGINNGIEALQIESYLSYYPQLIEKKWIPVSGDGCGNLYVLINDDRSHLFGTVCFLEVTGDFDFISYIVASDFLNFIFFLIKLEKGRKEWPFDKNYVVSLDRNILKYPEYLPWVNSN